MDAKSSHTTEVGGNVFTDLGFPADEAKALLAASRHIIALKLAIKTQLAIEIPS